MFRYGFGYVDVVGDGWIPSFDVAAGKLVLFDVFFDLNPSHDSTIRESPLKRLVQKEISKGISLGRIRGVSRWLMGRLLFPKGILERV